MNKPFAIIEKLRLEPEEVNQTDLVKLAAEIRPAEGEDLKEAEVRLEQFIDQVISDKNLTDRFSDFIRELLVKKNHIRLLTELGISSHPAFFAELGKRIYEKVLPPAIDKNELLDLVEDIFQQQDHLWVSSISNETWGKLFRLIAFSDNLNIYIADELFVPVTTSIQIISNRISSLGLEPDLIVRLPHIEQYHSPYLELAPEVTHYVDSLRENKPLEHIAGQYKHVLVLISQCKANLSVVWKDQRHKGVSIKLGYLIQRINQNLDRLQDLMELSVPMHPESKSLAIASFFKKLIQFENEKHSVRNHISSNTQMLARQIVEHTGNVGEHYIANTPKEYSKSLFQAMGGGWIIVFTTWLKFILSSLNTAPFLHGLLYSLNYAGSFVLIFLTHSTLATKQPAMTASALAKTLDDKHNRSINIESAAEFIIKMFRSQFVSFFGNLLIVLTVPYLIAWAYHYYTGDYIVEMPKAIKTVKDIDPFDSLSVMYAGFAGVFLFLSGLITGYYNNRVEYEEIPKRIRQHKWLKSKLSTKKLKSISLFVEKNWGGIVGNIALGFMLGFAAIIGHFTGLPIDIRHITLAGGSFSMAWFTLDTWVTPNILLVTLFGIFMIGLMNFAVSFSLTLWIALRSRKVTFKQTGDLLNRVWARFLTKPSDFFYPPSKKEFTIVTKLSK